MLYIPKIDHYLKIFTDDEVKNFVTISFSEYFKSAREKLYSKLSKNKILEKVDKSLYIFLATPGEEEKKIKNKLKELLS